MLIFGRVRELRKVTVSFVVSVCLSVRMEQLLDFMYFIDVNILGMRWAGHVARMGRRGEGIGSWWGNRRERDHLGDLGVDGWIILGWISRRWDVGMWTGLCWPRIGTGGGRL